MLIVENILCLCPIVFGSFLPVFTHAQFILLCCWHFDDLAYNTFFLLYLQDLGMLLFEIRLKNSLFTEYE